MHEFLDQHKFERRKERATRDCQVKSSQDQHNHPDKERRNRNITKSHKEGPVGLGENLRVFGQHGQTQSLAFMQCLESTRKD